MVGAKLDALLAREPPEGGQRRAVHVGHICGEEPLRRVFALLRSARVAQPNAPHRMRVSRHLLEAGEIYQDAGGYTQVSCASGRAARPRGARHIFGKRLNPLRSGRNAGRTTSRRVRAIETTPLRAAGAGQVRERQPFGKRAPSYTPFVLPPYVFRGCLAGRVPRCTKTLFIGRFSPQCGGLRCHPKEGSDAASGAGKSRRCSQRFRVSKAILAGPRESPDSCIAGGGICGAGRCYQRKSAIRNA